MKEESMTERVSPTDRLFLTAQALLAEVGYPITEERLTQALPLMREILAEIRILDELDLEGVEPITVFRVGV
jgi:hypothetical protein